MNNIELLELLTKKEIKQFELDSLLYGSIEIRNNNDKKYIYVHTYNDGIKSTKYIGDYTDVLYKMICEQNIAAKEIKKELRMINKKLEALNYVDKDLGEDVQNNIDFARRHLVDTIYQQAILEGVATTIANTEKIIEGGIINNMTAEDVMKIVNLKHAWDFILNKNIILSESDYSILCHINKIVEESFYYNAGNLRSTPVKISGTNWIPDFPIEIDIINDLKTITRKKNDDVDIAISLLLYVVKKQMFIDGNKRTSVIFANHYLISKGKGLIVIPEDKVDTYKKMLIDYYESNSDKELVQFIKKECYFKI